MVVRAQRLRAPRRRGGARSWSQDDGAGISARAAAPGLRPLPPRRRAAPGWGWPSARSSSSCTAARSGPRAPREGGAAFVFTLPLAQGAGSRRAEPRRRPPLGEQPRVLVVEDEPEIAAVLAEILRSRYRVEVARDGAEGLAKARALHPDLIVMDVFLPKLDGLDAAVALKSSSDTADIPVILLSAHQGVPTRSARSTSARSTTWASRSRRWSCSAAPSARSSCAAPSASCSAAVSLLRRAGQRPRDRPARPRGAASSRLEQELARSRRYSRPLTRGGAHPQRPLRRAGCAPARRWSASGCAPPTWSGHLGGGVLVVVLPECTEADGAPADRSPAAAESCRRATGIDCRTLLDGLDQRRPADGLLWTG